MPNRKSSPLLQLATAVGLVIAYFIARERKKRTPLSPANDASNNVYDLNAGGHALAGAALLLADLWAIPAVLRGKAAISTEELSAIDSALVPHYDRAALGYSGTRARQYQRTSDRVLGGLVAAPLVLTIAVRPMRAQWQSVSALYLWAQAVAYTLYSFSPLGPAFVDKYRPVVYYPDLEEAIRVAGNNRNARFSGHTACGACAAFFVATALRHFGLVRGAGSRAGIYVAALGPAMLLGWLRMKALKHFPSDVAQAIVIGAGYGALLPGLYRAQERKP